MGFDVAGDRCGIVSNIMYGFTDFPLSYMALVMASGVAFCVCLALIIAVTYRLENNAKTQIATSSVKRL